jgi:hypothetical protein
LLTLLNFSRLAQLAQRPTLSFFLFTAASVPLPDPPPSASSIAGPTSINHSILNQHQSNKKQGGKDLTSGGVVTAGLSCGLLWFGFASDILLHFRPLTIHRISTSYFTMSNNGNCKCGVL